MDFLHKHKVFQSNWQWSFPFSFSSLHTQTPPAFVCLNISIFLLSPLLTLHECYISVLSAFSLFTVKLEELAHLLSSHWSQWEIYFCIHFCIRVLRTLKLLEKFCKLIHYCFAELLPQNSVKIHVFTSAKWFTKLVS